MDREQIQPDPAEHDRTTHSPLQWFHCAKRLYNATSVLCEAFEQLFKKHGGATEDLASDPDIFRYGSTFRVLLMLHGMACECVLKGIWVQHRGRLIDDAGDYVGICRNDHDLPKVARKVSTRVPLGLSRRDFEMLGILSSEMILGRYPTHRNPNREVPSWLTLQGHGFTFPGHHEARNIIERLMTIFENGPPFPQGEPPG